MSSLKPLILIALTVASSLLAHSSSAATRVWDAGDAARSQSGLPSRAPSHGTLARIAENQRSMSACENPLPSAPANPARRISSAGALLALRKPDVAGSRADLWSADPS